MAVRVLPKHVARVRFPLLAPSNLFDVRRESKSLSISRGALRARYEDFTETVSFDSRYSHHQIYLMWYSNFGAAIVQWIEQDTPNV